jgi:hypothetical protein
VVEKTGPKKRVNKITQIIIINIWKRDGGGNIGKHIYKSTAANLTIRNIETKKRNTVITNSDGCKTTFIIN